MAHEEKSKYARALFHIGLCYDDFEGKNICDSTFYQKDYETLQELVNKQKEIEKIEEEIGIDLLTLFKALKNGIYIKPEDYCIQPDKRRLCYVSCDYDILTNFDEQFYLSEYGKTWALSKEELENDN